MTRFGVDLGDLVGQVFAPDDPVATLTVVTHGSFVAGLDGGKSKSTASYPCRARRTEYDSSRIDGELIRHEDCEIRVTKSSLPATVIPTSKDRITLNGVEYAIQHVSGNAATYVLHARGG